MPAAQERNTEIHEYMFKPHKKHVCMSRRGENKRGSSRRCCHGQGLLHQAGTPQRRESGYWVRSELFFPMAAGDLALLGLPKGQV